MTKHNPLNMNTIKLLNYNIHSCLNMDRRRSTARTAATLSRLCADIITLQEVDVHQKRSNYIHQAAYLAEQLDMNYHFFALKKNFDEQYGLAVMSRFPILDVVCTHLPAMPAARPIEKRGLIMARVKTPLGPVKLLNTHLSLRAGDRKLQANALAQNKWIQNCTGSEEPVVLCGDFNAGPGSFVYNTIADQLCDIQTINPARRYPRATFISWFPALRIDHIFVSHHLSPVRVSVPRDFETRMISDHLPLYAELAFVEREGF
ncbi:MAG: endonuclease/exonuclease/phosphatase family protein [Desulfonatronovibrio sp.]